MSTSNRLYGLHNEKLEKIREKKREQDFEQLEKEN